MDKFRNWFSYLKSNYQLKVLEVEDTRIDQLLGVNHYESKF